MLDFSCRLWEGRGPGYLPQKASTKNLSDRPGWVWDSLQIVEEKVGHGAEWSSPSAEGALTPVISKDSPFSLPDWCSLVLMLLILDFFSGPTRTEAAFFLPQHTTETEELKPQLRLLLSHFSIPYDMEELRDASKEIELFSLVLYGFFLNTNIGVHKRKY